MTGRRRGLKRLVGRAHSATRRQYVASCMLRGSRHPPVVPADGPEAASHRRHGWPLGQGVVTAPKAHSAVNEPALRALQGQASGMRRPPSAPRAPRSVDSRSCGRGETRPGSLGPARSSAWPIGLGPRRRRQRSCPTPRRRIRSRFTSCLRRPSVGATGTHDAAPSRCCCTRSPRSARSSVSLHGGLRPEPEVLVPSTHLGNLEETARTEAAERSSTRPPRGPRDGGKRGLRLPLRTGCRPGTVGLAKRSSPSVSRSVRSGGPGLVVRNCAEGAGCPFPAVPQGNPGASR